MVGFDGGAVALYGNQLVWLEQAGATASATANIPLAEDAVTVSLAVHRSGTAVAGFAVKRTPIDSLLDKGGKRFRDNLFVFARNETKPLWSRKSVEEAAEAPLPEKGRYSTPTFAGWPP